MKVIDILNRIANKEEVPKEIRYNNIDYFWCNQCKIYERLEDDSKDLYNDLDNLNDEVEIIEEDKKIEKIETKIGYGGLTYLIDENFNDGINGFTHRQHIIVDKINEFMK